MAAKKESKKKQCQPNFVTMPKRRTTLLPFMARQDKKMLLKLVLHISCSRNIHCIDPNLLVTLIEYCRLDWINFPKIRNSGPYSCLVTIFTLRSLYIFSTLSPSQPAHARTPTPTLSLSFRIDFIEKVRS